MRFLDIAVHCKLPFRDGGDLRTWELYKGLCATGAEGLLIGRASTCENAGQPQTFAPTHTWRDRKSLTAMLAFLTGKDYWQFKMITSGTRQQMAAAVRHEFDVVLQNFLYPLPLAQPFLKRGVPLIIDTHNYDPAYYGALAAGSRNAVLRHLCARAIRNAEKALASLPSNTVLVHVSEADVQRYKPHRPDLRHVIVENGAVIKPRNRFPNYSTADKRILMFVGGLSGKINLDALEHFSIRYWPKLRNVAEFRVVGSMPPASLQSLCAREGWSLFPNVSETRLEELYSEAHFSILPFEYGEGSKLKFFEACGRGVPVLATSAGLCGIMDYPSLVTKSDDPAEWMRRVESTLDITDGRVEQLITYARAFSWTVLSEKLRRIMDEVAAHRPKTRASELAVRA